MSRRITWPKIKRVWWCYNCNIPVMESVCPRCGGVAKRLSLSDPGDARPAFERDYKFLYSAYLYEFGTSRGFEYVLGRSPALLNKAPYYDEMKEVIVDGVHVGRLYFEPLLRRWRFRLSRLTAERLYSAYPDILETVVVDKKRFFHGDVFRVDRDIERWKQVVLLDRSGRVVGLGYSKGRGKIMVHSWWGPQDGGVDVPLETLRKSDMGDVIEAHRDYIRVLASRAKKFVAVMHSKVAKPAVISFSGGKDSLASLHLALGIGIEPLVLFNNTGIELPETVETVYRTVDRYGLRLVEASAGERFWGSVYELGIPGRDYRWCCKVCKLAPLSLTVKQNWPDGGLNIVGQRAFESIDRARSPRVWRLRWAPTMLNLSPILEWSQFDVWLYILYNKLEANPLYFMGYERIGCFMCPASTMAELELVSQTHRELWGRWLEVLGYWAKRLELPAEWIDYGLWRWNAPARYKSMLAARLGVRERVDDWRKTFKGMADPGVERVERGDGRLVVVLEKSVEIEGVERQIPTLAPESLAVDRENGYAEIRWGDASVEIRGRVLAASYVDEEDVEKLVDILKLVYRWRLCTGCRSCEAICPSGAASVKTAGDRPRPAVDGSRCASCKFCVYNCPVAEVYVEHVVAPLIFDDPEAWRRPTREHHGEVLEKIRSFVRSVIGVAKPEETRGESEELPDVSQFFQSL